MEEESKMVFEVLTAINALMLNSEFCKDDKAVIKANRFKKWLLSYGESHQLIK